MDEPHNPNLAALRSVYEHVKLLWDDEVLFSAQLVEKRKSLSTMLAVIVGLGIFRFGFTQRVDEKVALSPSAMVVAQVALTFALTAFSIGTYLLYTQRPTLRRARHHIYDLGSRSLAWLFRKARARTPEEADSHKMPPANPTKGKKKRVKDDENDSPPALFGGEEA